MKLIVVYKTCEGKEGQTRCSACEAGR